MSDLESDNKWVDFGRVLLQHRKRLGLTQKELLKKLDDNCIEVRSEATVSKWESGMSRPGAETVEVLEDIFGANRGDLMRLLGYVVEGIASTPPGAAAEKVPNGRTGVEQDMLVVEAKKGHMKDMVAYLRDCMDRFGLLPSMLYMLALRAGGRRELSRSESAAPGQWQVHSEGLNCWITIPGWSERAFMPWKWYLMDPMSDPLYDCLRQHLAESQADKCWESWDSAAERYHHSCLELWSSISHEVTELRSSILDPVVFDPEEKDIIIELSDSIYEELTWRYSAFGSYLMLETVGARDPYCQLNYEIVRESSQGWGTVVRLGSYPLVAAKGELMEDLQTWEDSVIEQVLVGPTRRLRDELLDKYTASGKLSDVIKLEREVVELRGPLDYELGLLLTKHILPGKCQACPDV